MAIQFKNPDTAFIFETDFENDVHVTVACNCNGGRGFSGFLSDLPPGAATELFAQKSNLVRPKPVKAKKPDSQ